MNLRKHGLLALCTTIENVKHYPKAVTFHKNEVTIYVRGSYRMASEDEYWMVEFSWCDGSAVNMLSTADGSALGYVKR